VQADHHDGAAGFDESQLQRKANRDLDLDDLSNQNIEVPKTIASQGYVRRMVYRAFPPVKYQP